MSFWALVVLVFTGAGVWAQEVLVSPFAGRLPWLDPLAVFAKVFAALPEKITILPSENYCYWQSSASGVPIRGNLRLPPNLRESGRLGFGYEEQVDDPVKQEKRSNARILGAADGVSVEQGTGPLEWRIQYQNRTVIFLLPDLEQSLPPGFVLGVGEHFLERARDESGLQFLLLFSEPAATFLWVLDDRQTEKLALEPINAQLLRDPRTEFLFLSENGRRTLAGVARKNILQNNAFDGPFDQLADQAAVKSERRKYLELAFPGLAGQMDAYGEYLEEGKPKRAAITPYFRYADAADVVKAVSAGADAWKLLGPLTKAAR